LELQLESLEKGGVVRNKRVGVSKGFAAYEEKHRWREDTDAKELQKSGKNKCITILAPGQRRP